MNDDVGFVVAGVAIGSIFGGPVGAVVGGLIGSAIQASVCPFCKTLMQRIQHHMHGTIWQCPKCGYWKH